MNLLIVIFVALACCGVIALMAVGMVLDARARRERLGGRGRFPVDGRPADAAKGEPEVRPDGQTRENGRSG